LKADLYDPNLDALQLASQLGIPIAGKIGAKGPKWSIFGVPILTVVDRQDQLTTLDLVTDDAVSDNGTSVEVFSQTNVIFVIDATRSKGAIQSAISAELDRLKAKNLLSTPAAPTEQVFRMHCVAGTRRYPWTA
jgi:nucleotide-binding universal stress UspA family protein